MKNAYGLFMGLGFELVALILLFMFIGGKIDDRLGTENIVRLLGIVFAFVIWFVHLMQVLKRTSSDTDASGQ